MKPRYILAPQAARDLVDIWRNIGRKAATKQSTAWYPAFAASFSIWRNSRTAVTGYMSSPQPKHDSSPRTRILLIYRPATKPLQIIAILHAHRDVAKILASGCPDKP